MIIRNYTYLLAATLVAVSMVFGLVACGSDDEPVASAPTASTGIDALYEAAKVEGSLTVMTNDDLYTRLAALGFAQKFPGITVNTEVGSPTERSAKIIEQSQAGRVTTDLVMGSGRDVEPIVSRGLVAGPNEVDWALLGYSPEFVHAEGHLALHWDFVYAHEYNTDLVSADELPDRLAEFTWPKWKDRVAASPFLYPAGMAFVSLARGEEVGVTLAKQIYDSSGLLLTTSQQQLVETGEAAVVMFSSINYTLKAQSDGAPVDYFFTPDMGTARLGFSILKDAPNPNAARLFVHWMSTDEGRQDLFDLDKKAMVSGPGIDNEFTKIIKDRKVSLVLESDANWKERARLTGVVREAIVGQ